MKRSKKAVEVSKFGGVNDLGSLKDERKVDFTSGMSGETSQRSGVGYDMRDLEVESKTKLQSDTGYGSPVIVRVFEFRFNPEAVAKVQNDQIPLDKQMLFNSHYKGIEMALWKDGFVPMPEVAPQVKIEGDKYRIFVGAKLAKGQILREKPMTLSQIANG